MVNIVGIGADDSITLSKQRTESAHFNEVFSNR